MLYWLFSELAPLFIEYFAYFFIHILLIVLSFPISHYFADFDRVFLW
jgi:hypothetical protein